MSQNRAKFVVEGRPWESYGGHGTPSHGTDEHELEMEKAGIKECEAWELYVCHKEEEPWWAVEDTVEYHRGYRAATASTLTVTSTSPVFGGMGPTPMRRRQHELSTFHQKADNP